MQCINNLADILTVQDLAEILLTTQQQIRKMLRAGTIRSLKVGREYRIPKVWLLEFLQLSA